MVDDHRHAWTYGKLRRSGEPYRHCEGCESVEVYYLDDISAEMELDEGN